MEIENETYGTKTAYVLVESEYIKIDDTVFINISEDLFGRDVYKFKYKDKCYSSHIILK
jgi:hypothetical protein